MLVGIFVGSWKSSVKFFNIYFLLVCYYMKQIMTSYKINQLIVLIILNSGIWFFGLRVLSFKENILIILTALIVNIFIFARFFYLSRVLKNNVSLLYIFIFFFLYCLPLSWCVWQVILINPKVIIRWLLWLITLILFYKGIRTSR